MVKRMKVGYVYLEIPEGTASHIISVTRPNVAKNCLAFYDVGVRPIIPLNASELMEQYERNILQHIEEHGCSVTSVFDPEEAEPPFSYSIGIARSSAAPELIIVGLGSKLSHWMVNEYNRRVRAGEQFLPGVLYLGFLEGFAVQFSPVAREHRAEYMRSTCWLHGGDEFEALQLIWPNTSGVWPWDAEASEWFRANQPLLAGEVA